MCNFSCHVNYELARKIIVGTLSLTNAKIQGTQEVSSTTNVEITHEKINQQGNPRNFESYVENLCAKKSQRKHNANTLTRCKSRH